MRRRKLLAALVGLAVLVTAGGFLLWPRSQPVPFLITDQKWDKLKKGMTLTEVVELLGPPGDYRIWSAAVYHMPRHGPQSDWKDWLCDDALYCIQFDEAGLVTDQYGEANEEGDGEEPNALRRIAVRAHRQWREWFP
jgi:outer membrane protein assembly factor BamE (lipoprotein component of BamABCDE complex)